MIKFLILKLIRLYQRTLSPDHGPLSILYSEGYCRFRPTCSEYTYQAIETFGIIKGGAMSLWRIMRCNPWGKGGWDPVVNSKFKIKNSKLDSKPISNI